MQHSAARSGAKSVKYPFERIIFIKLLVLSRKLLGSNEKRTPQIESDRRVSGWFVLRWVFTDYIKRLQYLTFIVITGETDRQDR